MGVVRTVAKPFVKWAGGKQNLAAHLVGYFPSAFETYYEPFVGGGSVFLALAPARAVLADANAWLIDCYLGIRDQWQAVAGKLDAMRNTREDFLAHRSVPPGNLPNTAARAAHFIYLNKTCFRGLFRVNRRGEFNVPYGDYRRRYYDAANLAAASAALAGVELRPGDFEVGLRGIGERDFVYLDPPYYKLGGYSDFNRYTASQFRDGDHVRLAKLCRELDQRGVLWAVSNSDTAFVRRLFDGFYLHPIAARREINLNSQRRDVAELLITNYPVQKRVEAQVQSLLWNE